MKNKKLNWRLSKLPTVEELQALIKDKIITQDEARGILFNEETEEEKDIKSLEKEVEFLRKLVEEMANNRNQIVEKINYIAKPYYRYDWYKPYLAYCSNDKIEISWESGTGNNMNLFQNMN